jgi:hypothetical protein
MDILDDDILSLWFYLDKHTVASIAELNEIKVPFLHINHLIESKKAVARPKDIQDII